MDHDLQTTLVPVARQLQRPVLPVLRYPLRTLPCTGAAPANLGRWAFTRRPAPHRPAWRWLASGRRHRGLAITATGDARPSGHPEAADGGRRTRFLGPYHLL